MAKFALIIPNNIWVCPYVSIYTKLLLEKDISYDIISWNRDGSSESGIQFYRPVHGHNIFNILYSYKRYAHFVKKTIRTNGYERLIVFTPQIAIFISSFLKKEYKDRYIFDYRDLSIEQNYLFKKSFKHVLENSYANVISSPGFIDYLPKGFDYILSHNFNIDIVKQSLNKRIEPYMGSKIRLLTIGAIRMDCNIDVIDAIGNVGDFELAFVGKGQAVSFIKSYVEKNNYKNIIFEGYYEKADEANIYIKSSLVNIIYPDKPSHSTALSNRFYNSLIYKRPMVVTKNTIQGYYAEKYGVGLVVNDCKALVENVHQYLKDLDYNKYNKQCNLLLQTFINDYNIYKQMIFNFIEDCY